MANKIFPSNMENPGRTSFNLEPSHRPHLFCCLSPAFVKPQWRLPYLPFELLQQPRRLIQTAELADPTDLTVMQRWIHSMPSNKKKFDLILSFFFKVIIIINCQEYVVNKYFLYKSVKKKFHDLVIIFMSIFFLFLNMRAPNSIEIFRIANEIKAITWANCGDWTVSLTIWAVSLPSEGGRKSRSCLIKSALLKMGWSTSVLRPSDRSTVNI